MALPIFETWAEDYNNQIYYLKETIKEPLKAAIAEYSNMAYDKKAAIQNILNVAYTLDISDDGKDSLVDMLRNGSSAQVKYLRPVALNEEEIFDAFKNAAHVVKFKNKAIGIVFEEVTKDTNLMSFISAQVEAKSAISK